MLVRNLRLSGETIAKIFTNKITNWNDPAITADNNGRALPSIPIIPVVRADGAGITNQFTTWMVSQHAALWQECNGGKLAPTDYFPLNCGDTRGPQKAQSGSDGVMNFVKSAGSNGAIAMEEYSYPLQAELPGAEGAQQGRLLHAAHAVQRGGRAHPGRDQQRPERPELPDPEARPGLRQRGQADLPAVVVRLRDHPDRLRRLADDDRQAADDRGLPQALDLRGAVRDRARSATRRCRSTWCRPASPRSTSSSSPTTTSSSTRRSSRTSRTATTRRSCRASRPRTTSPRSPPCPPTATAPGRVRAVTAWVRSTRTPTRTARRRRTAAATAAATVAATAAARRAAAAGPAIPTVDTDGDGAPDAPAPGADPALTDDLGLGGTTTTGDGAPATVVATTLAADASAGPPKVLTALVVGLFLGALVVPTAVSQGSRRRGRR